MILISFTLILSIFFESVILGTSESCEYEYTNGTGVSLRNLVNPSNSYIYGYAKSNLEFYLNPCTDSTKLPNFPENTMNDCVHGYTLCLHDSTAKHAYVLGTLKDTKLKEVEGQLFITFGTSNISSLILLQCTVNARQSVLYAPDDTKTNNINLTLFSDSACPFQLKATENGFFSTFFLIAFIILFTYLVVGIIYNYFFVGARGYELLPNYDFWTRAWTSIKLGFFYVKNGFRVVPTEDSYDAI